MIRLNKRTYERVVAELVYTNDIRKLVDRFSVDRILYFNILKDITSAESSPNYDLLKKIARKRKLSENFVIEQAKSVLNFYISYHQAELTDYYKILNVPYDATDDQIRRSWIELMKSYHPDKAGQDRLDEAKRINEAYAVLGNIEKREAYDQRYLPLIPVAVSGGGLGKNYYYGASIVLILIVVIYAAGSGLLFESREDKEILAKKIEQPALPNFAYRGDPIESVISEDMNESLKEDQKEDSTPSVASEQDITDSLSSEKKFGAFEPEEAQDEEAIASKPESTENAIDKLASVVITDGGDVTDDISQAVENDELAEAMPEEELEGLEVAEPNTDISETSENEIDGSRIEIAQGDVDTIDNKDRRAGNEELEQAVLDDELKETEIASESAVEVETGGESEMLAAADEKQEPAIEIKEEDVERFILRFQEPEDIDELEKIEDKEVAVLQKNADKEDSEESPGDVKLYKVQSGDSLWTIARKFDTTTDQLSRLNNLSENKIRPGQELVISGDAKPSVEAGEESIKKGDEVATEVVLKKEDPEKDKSEERIKLYKVKEGDSLWVIARMFDTTPDELARINQLSGKRIRPGQELIVSGTNPDPGKATTEPLKKQTASVKENITQAATDEDSPAQRKEKVKEYAPAFSATAVSVSKQNIAPSYKAASAPDQDSLYKFVSEYASAYKNRDLGKIEALFAPDGVENGRSFSSIINNYKASFDSLDIISYNIKVNNVNLRETIGYVRGDFYIKFKDQRTGAMKNSRGTIDWQLSWKGGTWEIINLSYKIEKTDNVGG